MLSVGPGADVACNVGRSVMPGDMVVNILIVPPIAFSQSLNALVGQVKRKKNRACLPSSLHRRHACRVPRSIAYRMQRYAWPVQQALGSGNPKMAGTWLQVRPGSL